MDVSSVYIPRNVVFLYWFFLKSAICNKHDLKGCKFVKTKQLLEYEFQFVQVIQPVQNKDGSIREVTPQDRYEKRESSKLHKYGSGTYCYFSIDAAKWAGVSGVYTIYIENQLIYIGQAQNLAKRFNQEYGSISPRACYEHGQTTNCKINQVVLNAAKAGKQIELFFLTTPYYQKIEEELIRFYNPQYNVALRSDRATDQFEQRRTRARTTDYTSSKKSTSEKTAKNVSTDEVRAYIQELIQTAKSNGLHELTLRSGEIHSLLGMDRAMPTVCRAMRTLRGDYKYIVIEQPPKGKGSRLVFRYLF